MKIFLSALAFTLMMNNSTWLTNINDAKQIAQKEKKYILLNFSGSDWCGPCIRMHKEIFDSEVFSKYANSTLVLVNADFPRMKKNQLTSAQQKINDATADTYNPNGIFPYTLLLDANGKILKAWEGFYDKGAENFTTLVQQIIANNTLQK
jgi:thioredoxin-related protein